MTLDDAVPQCMASHPSGAGRLAAFTSFDDFHSALEHAFPIPPQEGVLVAAHYNAYGEDGIIRVAAAFHSTLASRCWFAQRPHWSGPTAQPLILTHSLLRLIRLLSTSPVCGLCTAGTVGCWCKPVSPPSMRPAGSFPRETHLPLCLPRLCFRPLSSLVCISGPLGRGRSSRACVDTGHPTGRGKLPCHVVDLPRAGCRHCSCSYNGSSPDKDLLPWSPSGLAWL